MQLEFHLFNSRTLTLYNSESFLYIWMCEPMTQIMHKAKALCTNNIAAKTKEKKVSDERWLILACIVTVESGL